MSLERRCPVAQRASHQDHRRCGGRTVGVGTPHQCDSGHQCHRYYQPSCRVHRSKQTRGTGVVEEGVRGNCLAVQTFIESIEVPSHGLDSLLDFLATLNWKPVTAVLTLDKPVEHVLEAEVERVFVQQGFALRTHGDRFGHMPHLTGPDALLASSSAACCVLLGGVAA